MLQDCMGKVISSWDSRGQTFQTSYDALRQLLQVVVTTPGVTVTAEIYVYGESNPTAAQNNQLGKVWQASDQSGTVTNEMYDFKGNLAWNRRQFAQEYKTMVNWSAAVLLDPRQFDTRITYDALNRVVERTTPDTSITHYDYNQARLVQAVKANIGGAQLNGQPNWTQFVFDVDYNSRGQRIAIQHGNGVSVNSAYDPLTFRVSRIQTLAEAGALQDLNYFYDSIGNVTYIRDDAQQTAYFRNAVVTPSNDYTYDPIYRLIVATGREHLGQINGVLRAITFRQRDHRIKSQQCQCNGGLY
jgi:YD repeat-containing protein